MAIFFPSIEDIELGCLTEPVTSGELSLLHILKDLDDSYEVFFQTHINMRHPDIVIVRKNGGVLIIEVKDWKLSSYTYHDYPDSKFGIMNVVQDGRQYIVETPFEQANKYKNQLYDVLSSALHIGRVINNRIYGCSTAAVYFSTEPEKSIEQFFGSDHFKDKRSGKVFKDWYITWGCDSKQIINNVKYILRDNNLFTSEMYKQVKSLFAPSFEIIEQQSVPVLVGNQIQYAESKPNITQKIKGVAGSGKTLVLAHRAVAAFKRTHCPILILTFNITLTHSIHDTVSRILRDEKIPKNAFHFYHIHAFVRAMVDKYGIPCRGTSESPESLLSKRIEKLREYSSVMHYTRYDAILIDEVQDFQYDWLVLLRDLFLAPQGEFVVFGDEKQNIYGRQLEEKLPRTPIKGRWAELKVNYRTTKEIGELAFAFQKKYFSEKYDIIQADYAQQIDMFELLIPRQEIRYFDISDVSNEAEAVCQIAQHFHSVNSDISWNDICILTENHELSRRISNIFEKNYHISSATVSENQSEYEALSSALDAYQLQQELQKVRRIKKEAFWMNQGVMKICTVHSFKGWEISNVFLIIEAENTYTDLTRPSDELIYTAMTRAKNSLIVINHGNARYRDFFEEHIGISSHH